MIIIKVLSNIVSYPNILFSLSVLILLLNFIRKNNNFFDVRTVFVQQFEMFKNCKGQLVVFYVVPLLLAAGSVATKCIEKDMINNIIIVISIFISMIFAMLSILGGYNNKNPNYVKTLNETHNTIIFECVLCIIVLILSFVTLFIDEYDYNKSLLIVSGTIYYLMFTIVLHVLVIIKRMKALFDNK